MLVYTVKQARANFFKLLTEVESGQQIIIADLDDRTLFRVTRLDDEGSGQGTVARKPLARRFLSRPTHQTHWEDHGRS